MSVIIASEPLQNKELGEQVSVCSQAVTDD